MGVLAAGVAGGLIGTLHAVICSLRRVNSVAVGIAMMFFFYGLACYMGKPYIQPSAPQLQPLKLGDWSSIEQVRAALRVNVLFLFGVGLALLMAWMLKYTRWGMMIRVAGESEEAAAAMGYSVIAIRIVATALGGVLAGIGGSYLSLYYPAPGPSRFPLARGSWRLPWSSSRSGTRSAAWARPCSSAGSAR
jgi:simple sugar transport system permease protein